MSTGIVLQARSGSTRMPQKMIIPFYAETGILQTLLLRLIQENFNVPIVLATSINPKDDEIERIGQNVGVNVYRGSENNVLERFIGAANAYNFDKLIRVCADNPFLDMKCLKHQIDAFKHSDTDYWCYCKSDLTPTIKTHFGFWTEGVKRSALKKIGELTNEIIYQEHVTNFIYSHPEIFKIHFEHISELVESSENIRLTIDTPNDFKLAQEIYAVVNQNNIPMDSNDIVQLVKQNPNWLYQMEQEINKNLK